MTPESIAKRYFTESIVMQVATLTTTGAPRVNSVYFVAADDMTVVYWMSEPRRRHSDAITHDARMAGAIAAKTDWPVAGLQFTGSGSVLEDSDEELRTVIDRYNAKYHGAAKGLYERIQNGTNKHLIYRMTVESLELFDEVHFPGGKVVSVTLA